MDRFITTTKEKVEALRRVKVLNIDNLFGRIGNGETFTADQLREIGYDYFDARNVAYFLKTGDRESLRWQ